MSNMLRKTVLMAAGVALVQMGTLATAQTKTATEKTVAIKAEANMARSLAGPLTMTREQRLAAKPVDVKAATGTQKKAPEMSAEDKAILAAAQPEMSAGGAPNSSADDEARRDFSEEWKAMDQQDR